MKRRSLAIGLLIVLLAVWVSIGDPGSPGTGPVRTDSAPQPDFVIDPVDALAAPPEATSVEAEPIVEQAASAESCAELSQRAEIANVRYGFAEGRQDERSCAMMLQLMFGPMVPAIPGYAGFEVRDVGEASPRNTLANERDSPEWARPMESAILAEIATLIDFPVSNLHASCRSSTCGLLFAYRSADHHGGNYNFYAQQVADGLGFSGFHAGHARNTNGNAFTYVYLGSWDTQRPEEISATERPATFEEFAESLRNE